MDPRDALPYVHRVVHTTLSVRDKLAVDRRNVLSTSLD